MKSLISLCILILCTACLPQGLPAAEPSPTFIATQPPLATTKQAFTSFPTPTVWLTPTAVELPAPLSILGGVIDNAVISQQGQLYASGSGMDDVRRFAQWDGTTWIELGNGLPNWNNTLAVDGAGHLYALAAHGETEISQWDGAIWKNINGNFSSVADALATGRVSSNFLLAELAVDREDNLYVAGCFYYQNADHNYYERPMGFVAKWNKETWTVLGQGFDGVCIQELAVSTIGKVYVTGENQSPDNGGGASYVAQWNGKTWTRIDTSKLDSKLDITAYGLAVDNSEHLYVSGPLNTPMGNGLVARWDGVDWTILTEQLDDSLVHMAADNNGHLYIAGSFESVDGILVRHIAYWDGSLWHALGYGVNGDVNALAFDPSGDLYALGGFDEAGGLPAYHVARWDGEAWHAPMAELYPASPLSIFKSLIDSVVTDQQGQLYVSGLGGDNDRYFARWDGAKWTGLGYSLPYWNNALVVDGAGHLYTLAAGGGIKIMQWDGAVWKDISGNLSTLIDTFRAGRLASQFTVMGLAVDGEDNLYVAGHFFYQSANRNDDGPMYDEPMSFVAKWNKETWTVLGQGFDRAQIFGLAVSTTGKVYVTSEDKSPAGINSYVAQWDGKTWTRINTTKLDNKLENTVYGLAVDKSERLYVSGPLPNKDKLVARWDGVDWTILIEQLGGTMYDIAVDANGHFYIAGSFESVNGVPAHNIAYWDGSLWHALGEGVNDDVLAFTFSSGGDLYAVGRFTEAGGLPAYHIARWNGETWHALEP